MCLSIEVHYPERVLNKGEHKGFKWVVTHNAMGFRCGYVRVPAGHPWHGKQWDEISCDCHGGITFAEPDVACEGPGDDSAYWIGFDCAHFGDAADPDLPDAVDVSSGVVRSQQYVEECCISLCCQAESAAK